MQRIRVTEGTVYFKFTIFNRTVPFKLEIGQNLSHCSALNWRPFLTVVVLPLPLPSPPPLTLSLQHSPPRRISPCKLIHLLISTIYESSQLQTHPRPVSKKNTHYSGTSIQCNEPLYIEILGVSRLRVDPHFASLTVERARRERA